MEGTNRREVFGQLFRFVITGGFVTALGIAEREAARVEREYRERDRERYEAQTESGDLKTLLERSFAHSPLED